MEETKLETIAKEDEDKDFELLTITAKAHKKIGSSNTLFVENIMALRMFDNHDKIIECLKRHGFMGDGVRAKLRTFYKSFEVGKENDEKKTVTEGLDANKKGL